MSHTLGKFGLSLRTEDMNGLRELPVADVDSRWTLTIVGGELRVVGSGPVRSVALADTVGRTVT